MPAGSLDNVVRQLRALAAAGHFQSLSDSQLLELFAADRDELAFKTLVRRHGPLVNGVCRRFLGPEPDVDDVFQAAFLVLARKAGSIRRQASVASWLYGVTFRLARKMRARLGRRRRREQTGEALEAMAEKRPMSSNPAEQASLRELGAILDEEVQRLPEKNREAIVLCHLEGLSGAEAAKRLGCPLPTLKSRLERGRELLRQRLVRRGVTLSVAGVAVVFAEQAACAAVPLRVLLAATQGAVAFAEKPVASAAVSAQAAALAQGMLKMAAIAKLSLALFAVLTTALLGLGATLLPSQTPSAAPPKDEPPQLAISAAQPPLAPKDQYGDPLPTGALARLGTTRWRHGGLVNFAAFAPDGKTVISADDDGIIHVWEYPSGKEIRHFGEPDPADPMGASARRVSRRNGRAASVALTRDAKTFAANFDNTEIVVYSVETGMKLAALKTGADQNRSAIALAFSPNSRQIAGIDLDNTIHIWDWANGKELRKFAGSPRDRIELNRNPTALVYSLDGKALIATCSERDKNIVTTVSLKIYDADMGDALRVNRTDVGKLCALPVFSPDRKTLAFPAQNGTAILVEVATGKEILRFHTGQSGLAFSRDGSKLFSYSGYLYSSQVDEYSVATGKQLRHLGQQPETYTGLFPVDVPCLYMAVAPDGGGLIACGGPDHVLHFYDLISAQEIGTFTAHAAPVLTVHFTPDGEQLITQSNDVIPLKWDAITGKSLGKVLPPQPSQTLYSVLSPDGKFFAFQTLDNIAFVEVSAGKELGKFPRPDRESSYGNMVFAPNSKFFAIQWRDQQRIELYETPTGKLLHTFSFIAGAMRESNRFVSDKTVAHETMLFSPDSSIFATFADPKSFGIWDVKSGNRIGTQPLPDRNPIKSAAFSPDCRCLAFDMNDGTVNVYELASAKRRRTFGQHFDLPKYVEPNFWALTRLTPFGQQIGSRVDFSPDGKTLANAGLDRNVHLWDIATGRELAAFKGQGCPLGAVSFAPDGKKLASANADATVLLWDVAGLKKQSGIPPRKLTEAELQAGWNELAGADAATAFDAILTLEADPVHAVPFLQQQVKPAQPLDGERVKLLIGQLDDGQFKVREKAVAELRELGEQLVPFLEKALAANPPLEVRRRLEAVRDHQQANLMTLTPDRLRMVRAIEVLERIGSAQALRLLQNLADGPPSALETVTARSALRRMRG